MASEAYFALDIVAVDAFGTADLDAVAYPLVVDSHSHSDQVLDSAVF